MAISSVKNVIQIKKSNTPFQSIPLLLLLEVNVLYIYVIQTFLLGLSLSWLVFTLKTVVIQFSFCNTLSFFQQAETLLNSLNFDFSVCGGIVYE